MSKDDWPESTEAGVQIEEAYRKGWLSRDLAPSVELQAKKRRRPKYMGQVRVDFAKGVPGFTAHSGFGDVYPIFPTQEKVREWLQAKGFYQTGDNPEIWER